jgi:holo-[acyl-carrier protein] synthase
MTAIIKTGIDIIEIKRVSEVIKRQGDRFLNRIFTPVELEDCKGNVNSLAVRFAAKEAAAKALGCGIGRVSWKDIEVIRNSDHQPDLALHGAVVELAKEMKLSNWSVSLSHTNQNAIAVVIASGED